MNVIKKSEITIKEFEVRNLIFFVLIAFGWTWLFYLPSILSPTGGGRTSTGNIELHILILEIIGNFGPLVGAVSLTFINEGKEGVKQLWKRFWNFHIKKKWVIVIFLLFPIISGIAFSTAIFTEGLIVELIWLSQPWLLILWFIMLFTFAGGLAEEFGWRGYALDRLQAKCNALYSSIALGVIWAFWHLPFWFVAGGTHQEGSFLGFLIVVIFLSILYTWIYNNTEGNLLAATIFHAMSNLAIIIIFPIGQNTTAGFYYVLILGIFSTLIVVIFKPKTLKRNL
ncbi:MAG: CPBP family intramembrane glutamic endopeptidase [Promethearchaeota archaeon]